MTEREQIEQRIAENERKMAESERNMIELERNMAKQIKDFLDKGIPKADIAKAAEFSLEYIDSLLEKFYPQTGGTERTSDIESQLNFLKQQVQILQNKLDNQEFENVQLKQQLNTIQAKRTNMAENNEPIQTQQAVQQWEYMSSRLMGGMEELKKLGDQGWEVVDGLRMDAGRETVFKRPKTTKETTIK
ncbi:MAG: hypothetical protein J5978_00775 [Spirochaetaceae bacterium]|nr:hypothetical protein [Spirochaetaceae bacterium]